MKNTNSAAKTLFFALCAFFLFNAQLFAVSPSTDGCHKMNGCTTGAAYNASPYTEPTYAPSWTEVTTTSGRVKGGDYLRFSVNEGDIYQWSTEGKEDVFTGEYSKACTYDTECAANYEITGGVGLRCIGGYCLLPFDTELTLIKGTTCSGSVNASDFLAYSNSDGYRNQSQLEWKATFTGSVTLLVTNYEYQTGSSGEFKSCQQTTGNQNTTVKWRRTSSEHCDVCGISDDFKLSAGTGADAANVAAAPSWTAVQESGVTNFLDADLGTWIKPGSYITFQVKENEIYRWSTCKSALHDTQLTLFKGDVDNDADHDSCGDFLAYGDDSEVSYIENSKTYCPAGTKQTVLEWHANFTGSVTLLFSEYNCYQCSPQKNPVTHENNWLSCFDTVGGTYQATVNGDGTKTVVTDGDGFPVAASSSCNPALADSPCVVASYIYTYPLHWQRYDCRTCNTRAAKIADQADGSGWQEFTEDGGSQSLAAGEYAAFSLTRGSKYLFKAGRASSIITIKKGDGCGGDTIAQGTGQLAYFANSDDYDYDEGTFGPDVISVYVSDSDCNSGSNTLIYSYYNGENGGNVQKRFTEAKYGSSDVVITDTTTQLQFADTGAWVDSWQKAIKKCQEHSVGGSGDEGTSLKCPQRICPAGNYDPPTNPDADFCTFKGSNTLCDPPVCSTGYAELEKKATTSGSQVIIQNEDERDYWGQCYYNGSLCDQTDTITTGIADGPKTPDQQCRKAESEKYYEGHLLKYRYYCPDGYVWTYKHELSSTTYTFKYCCTCNSGYVLEADNKCYKYQTSTECKPVDEQICVGREVGCNEGIVSPGCPSGYTEQSDGRCLSDDEVGYNVYDDVVEKNPSLGTFYSTDRTCPYSTNSVGEECDYSNCFTYVYEADIQEWSGYKVDKNTGTDTMYGKYPKCYKTSNKTGSGRCCATGDKIVINDGGETGERIAASDFYYATALNPNGTVASAEKWKAQKKTCPSGYNYELSNGKCGRCGSGYYISWEGDGDEREYYCYRCSNGEFFNGKCQTCNTGYTLGHTGGEGGTDPEYYCKKECPADGYEITEGSTLKCYTNIADKVNKCTAAGWIQDPNDPGKCRKIQSSGGSPAYVECENGTLKDEGPGKTCDTSKPNSYDCDCKNPTTRCEDTSTTLADARVCPTEYVTEKYVCGGSPYRPKYCQDTYPITTIPKTIIFEGSSVEIAGVCSFTDKNGQTCGEAMGGWTLPNINQLYSIVDFDLYDPATAYPDIEYSRGTPDSATCSKTESANTACTDSDQCPDYNDCIGGKCISTDPFGDLKCKTDGSFLCVDNKCVRNNWFWSSTTVTSEKEDSAKFTWAVNMEDGRSYRALKGCVGEECGTTVDTTARRHRVICIKGSAIAGIFDTDAPTLEQTFSGWACDKDDDEQSLGIYFEITDNSESTKNVVAMLPASEYIKSIPGQGDNKALYYGATDVKPESGNKASEIFNNCNFKSDPAPHAFEIKWNGSVTAGKDELAALIMSIADIQCSDDTITAYYNAVNSGSGTYPDVSGCALPPYFVTAYGVNEGSTTPTAVAIAPTQRPFVIKNVCGDGYKTFDGDYQENCENDIFNRVCGYNNTSCELCTKEGFTKNGHTYMPCQLYPADPPRCMDGILQSEYCEDGVVAEGHTGAGLACEKYNFSANNILSMSEECDCPTGSFYYYEDPEHFTCSHPLDQNVCPEYNTTRTAADKTPTEEDVCYICSGCQRSRVEKAYCGDEKIQRADCTGYAKCEVVPGANEECDDANLSNTDSCTNNCKEAYCGDGYIQTGEQCDSGAKNGYYETNCQSDDVRCPGCASITCGKDDSDALGPRCGDGKIQNKSLCTANAATLAANGYSSQADFFSKNGFEDEADCLLKLNGAAEVCDLGTDADGKPLNGTPVTFEAFLETPEATGCYKEIKGEKIPVNAIHANFAECIYKYKQFVHDNPGCSSDCKTKVAPYCGDIPVGEGNPGDLADKENCDNGLPEVSYDAGTGKYTIAAGTSNYNGKAYGSCRLDCKGRYECDNGFVEKGKEACTGLTIEGFCPSIGDEDSKEAVLYVTGGWEKCDEGKDYNGTYGHCDSCLDVAKCGGTTPAINEIYPGKYEECDFGDGNEGNKPYDEAYKAEYGKSCVAEAGCDGEYTTWGNKRCCVYGRFCGDGTVDNGLVNNDGVFKEWRGKKIVTLSDGTKQTVYEPEDNWSLDGADVEYDVSNFALRFTLTGEEATVVFNKSFDINPSARYFMELDLMLIPAGEEELSFDAGAMEYSATGTDPLRSPFYFVDIINPSPVYLSNIWYHGRNGGPIEGVGTDPNKWYTGTEKVKVIFHMSGAEGTQFLVRSFSFYDLESVNYKSETDKSEEMCDPGDGNFKSGSGYYMQDCKDDCTWINYCGDGVVQRPGSGECVDGKYNGYDCVDGITGAGEICDKGYVAGKTANIANTYNGCEPGCRKLGPRCGDGRIDCPEGSTYAACGNYAKSMSAAQQEQCDNASDNHNDAITGELPAGSTSGNYGDCRPNCKFARCGDGVWDKDAYVMEEVPLRDENGNIVYVIDENTGDYVYVNGEKVPEMTNVKRYLEECDCGEPGSYDAAVTGEYKVKLKDGSDFFICKDGSRAVYNSNTEKRSAVCRPNCTVSRCGDGVLDVGANEECDDGNDNDHDSCKNDCTFNRCNDGVFAYTRSYLCEELIGMSAEELRAMAKKGIVDCDGTGQVSCEALKDDMATSSAVADRFDEGVLHCCYDIKLRNGGAGDGNCKFEYVNNSTMEKKRLSPKELAVQLCKDNADNYSIPDDNCNAAEQIERCEYCKDADCGCAKQYPNHATTEKTAYEACLETNRYCISSASSKSRCWNVFGACGDGKIDEAAGEQCDDFKVGNQGDFKDLDGNTQNGGTAGIGTYCTGLCRGTCGVGSPRCTSEGQLGCWTSGCDRKQHDNNNDISDGNSRCGDGKIDVYATGKDPNTGATIQLEECDDGSDAHSDSGAEAYCSKKCKKNKYNGQDASCGDGHIQNKVEICDDGADNDTYCVENCTVYYGTCGDNELHGPGYNLYDTMNQLSASTNGSAGPEYCDLKDNGGGSYDGDARSVSLAQAGATNFCIGCGVDTVPYECGDGERNPRFEGCDFGSGNNDGTVTCTNPVAANNTVSDFGLCTTNSGGKGTKCYKGCKSDAIGGLVQAASFGIYGWACDPDHPMTHEYTKDGVKKGFVTLKFFNKNGGELAGSPVVLKTDWNFGTTTDELAAGQDVNGYTIDQNFTVRACGGGNKHGWFFDPSKASGVTFKDGPYTVWAYAKSLDSGEDGNSDNVDNMIFLGKASFAMAMSCGDKVVSKCSDITVRVKDPSASSGYADVQWSDGRICADDSLYGGKKCDVDYGLVNNQACKSETCDNGTAYNKPEYDCGSDCQWTKCGDSSIQTKAGKSYFTGYEFRPADKRAKPNDPEECEYSVTASKSCDDLFKDNKPAGAEIISDTANCVKDNCKWNVKNVCRARSECPALSTADMLADTGTYQKPAGTYIKYVNSGNPPKYIRTWNNDSMAGSWPAALTKVQHISEVTADTPEAQCAFECVDDLVWDSAQHKCVGRDGENGHGNLTHNCGNTPCGDSVNGVWAGNTADSPTNNQCYGGTTNPQIDYYTEIDGSGNIVAFHKNGNNTKEYYNNDTGRPQAVYGSVADGKNCIFRCNSDSVYGNDKVCHDNTLNHTCKTPTGPSTFTAAEHRVWVKIWKENKQIKMQTLPQTETLVIQRALNAECGSGGTCSYTPNTTDLAAVEINDANKGIIKQKDILGTSENDPVRCFYTCASGYKLNTAGTACEDANEGNQCGGNTVIHSEHCDLIVGTKMADGRGCRFTPGAHELCEDGANNGKYGPATNELSHCKKDCGKDDEAAFLDCVAQNLTDYKTRCGDGTYGRIAGGNEYFCGDGYVQYKSDESCSGVTCKSITNYNTTYVDTSSSSFAASEQCDPGDSNTRKTLCDRYLSMNGKSTGSSYHDTGTISCSNGCEITGDKTCAFCGDGTLNASEDCGEGSGDDNIYSVGNTAKGRCAAAFNPSNGSTYTINIPGVYCFTVKGGDGNVGHSGGNGCSGATVNGCYELKKGDKLTFKVGSAGASRSTMSSPCGSYYGGGGGGGASWIYLTRNSSNILLLVAGGGGGGGWSTGSCGGGSNTNSATSGTNGNGSECSKLSANAGTAVTSSNFTSSTGAGGSGGYHYTTSGCNDDNCDSKYSCGGGGGGYNAGAKGSQDGGGGGGGSYVNEDSDYYNSGKSMTAGSINISSITAGSITVKKPNSNAICSSSSCQWSTGYTTCP